MSSFSLSLENNKESEEKYKDEVKRYEWFTQKNQYYEGFTLYGNLHGSGTYFIDDEYCNYCDGLFYLNKLEGYCQIFYSKSETHFQGLFKDNKRFGPGVLTYNDGRQDIGIWDGYSLIRIGGANPSLITSLANTNTGYIRLLKFRNLVNVSPRKLLDVSKELLECLGANDDVLKRSDELYNNNIKNKDNIFFPKSEFENHYARTSCAIDILTDGSDCNMSIGSKTEEEEEEITMIKNKIDFLDKRIQDCETQLRNFEKNKENLQQQIDICTQCCITDNQSKNSEYSTPTEKKTFNSIILDFGGGVNGQQKNEENFFVQKNFEPSIISFTGEKFDEILAQSNPNIYDEYILLENLESCTCFEKFGVEDKVSLENELSIMSNKCAFYSMIIAHLSEKRTTLLCQLNYRETVNLKKITPTNVLAWNNEPLLIEIMKHSFLCRKTEYMVNFNLTDVLSGLREGFGQPGDMETACADFFTICSDGDNVSVIRYLRTTNFNVNVSDAMGNTGVFFAAVNNRCETIRILAEFGANMNQLNDECLTPLSRCLICYLSKKYQVDNYEEAFIPKPVDVEENDNGKCWYASRSLMDIIDKRSNSVRFMSKTNEASKTKQSKGIRKFPSATEAVKTSNFIFSTNYPNFKLEPKNKAKADSLNSVDDSDFVQYLLKVIEETIETLLNYGAKPYYGNCPIPVFLMSLYTENENIVKIFLENGADVNVVTNDEELNALHIMASAKCTENNLRICQILLSYKCNPNHKSRAHHWNEIKEKLLSFVSAESYDDVEKNPLHTLCLRTDFRSDNCDYFESVTEALVRAGINVKSTYLGQDALRLAMISGNMNLVRFLIDLDIIDPYRVVKDEGNILTIFFTNRFINILPFDAIKKMIENVINKNVSPLNAIDECCNVADYVNKNIITNLQLKKKKKQKQEPNMLGLNTNIIKKNKKFVKKLADFVSVLTRRKILERLSLILTKLLFSFAEENLLTNDYIKPIALYVSPQIFLTNLKIFFNYGIFHKTRFKLNLIQDAMNFLSENCKITPVKSKKSSKTKTKKKEKEVITPEAMLQTFLNDMENINFNEKKLKKKKYKLFPPGLDDPERYKVCIECFKPVSEFLCPICQQIYFCSTKCYKKHTKRKSDKHLCNCNVFDDVTTSKNIGIMDLFNAVQEFSVPHYVSETPTKRTTEKLQNYSQTGTPTKFKREVMTMADKKVIQSNYLQDKNSKNDEKQSKQVGKGNLFTEEQKLDRNVKSESNTYNGVSGKKDHKKAKENTSEKHAEKRKDDDWVHDNIEDNHRRIASKFNEVFESSPKVGRKENGLNINLDLKDKKTERVPRFENVLSKPVYFLEILSKLLPHVNWKDIVLPFVCYSDGHLYYTFRNSLLFCHNYSQN